MGDIAAYMKNEKFSINDIKLTPQELGELIASIKGGTISGKIGKEVSTFSSVNCTSDILMFRQCVNVCFKFPFRQCDYLWFTMKYADTD